jgi:hypothetical protein
MIRKPLFHVERVVRNIPVHSGEGLSNQVPAGWGRRSIGLQKAPAVRRRATFGQLGPWRHGSKLILEVRDARGRKSLRYVREVSTNG